MTTSPPGPALVTTAIDRELRIAGILLMLGLALTVVTLIWKAPLAFLLFAGVAAVLTLAGVSVYLYSLVSARAVTRVGRFRDAPPERWPTKSG